VGVEPQQIAPGSGVLRRVLCGVDGSPAGEEAVRQGVRLRAPDGRLLLASVATPAAAAHAEAAVALEVHAAAALREAAREAGADCESHLLVGESVVCLLAAARDYGATLVAVGSHGTSRLGGILAGSVATAMLHRAACSVLVARPPGDSRRSRRESRWGMTARRLRAPR
jgi:nucleotide-binding universal stress UspA family protein